MAEIGEGLEKLYVFIKQAAILHERYKTNTEIHENNTSSDIKNGRGVFE